MDAKTPMRTDMVTRDTVITKMDELAGRRSQATFKVKTLSYHLFEDAQAEHGLRSEDVDFFYSRVNYLFNKIRADYDAHLRHMGGGRWRWVSEAERGRRALEKTKREMESADMADLLKTLGFDRKPDRDGNVTLSVTELRSLLNAAVGMAAVEDGSNS